MRAKNIALASLASLALTSCGGDITLPDIKACSVAGVMAAGADCATTLSNVQSSMDLQQFIEFLEPTKERSGAICMPSDDFRKLKTVLQQACEILGSSCKREVREALKSADRAIADLESKARKQNGRGKI